MVKKLGVDLNNRKQRQPRSTAGAKTLTTAPVPVGPTSPLPPPPYDANTIAPLPFVDDDEFVFALAFESIKEMDELSEAAKRVGCNATEWGHIEEDSSKPSYSEQEALAFALDAFGRRRINVETWEAYKSKNGWLLRDSKKRDRGFVPIRDRWTVRVLEKVFPNAVCLDVEKARCLAPGKRSFENPADPMADHIENDFSKQLSDVQKSILAQLYAHYDGLGR